MIRIGCSGWNYADWREPVYHGRPAREWLALYAESFSTVEVNSSFYRLPRRTAVAGWADATPPGFVFAVKVSRYLTHIRRLADAADGYRRLFERIEPLAETDKLGPLLWQLPENFRRDDDRLARALAELPAGRHCFEFRHPSWFCRPVYRLLREAGAALVTADDARRPLPEHEHTARWTYARFHYGRRGRRGNYSESELRDWAGVVRRAGRRGDVYGYFNNDWEGFAVRNARALARFTSRRGG
jgi:uncharacterized protein YecE (DUF72 family)